MHIYIYITKLSIGENTISISNAFICVLRMVLLQKDIVSIHHYFMLHSTEWQK